MAPEDVRRLVDIEADLDERYISQVRFGRSRFLRTAGLALFALATGLVAESEAQAAPTPEGCRNATCHRNHTGGYHCWRTQVGCKIYKCCDWRYNGEVCICRGFVGTAC
jgi:hypothetical protein